jgi:hypothetical protein
MRRSHVSKVPTIYAATLTAVADAMSERMEPLNDSLDPLVGFRCEQPGCILEGGHDDSHRCESIEPLFNDSTDDTDDEDRIQAERARGRFNRPDDSDPGIEPLFDSHRDPVAVALVIADRWGTDGRNQTPTGNDEWDTVADAMCVLAYEVRRLEARRGY